MIAWMHDHLFDAAWSLWLLYWLVAAFGGKKVQRKESLLSRLSHFGPLAVAGWLLAADHLPGHVLEQRLWPVSEGVFWSGAALLIGGLLFSCWARIHLGRNWSGAVTVKEGHELIRTGPYAFVRHPIYTGLLMGFAGTALVVAEWRGIAAVILVVLALRWKLGLEERWMVETFGERYATYKRKVKALVPFML